MTTLATIDISGLRARSTPPDSPGAAVRWRVADVEALFALPFMDLLHQAQQVHRENFDPNEVQLSTLLSIKTGGCSEDCGYCPQSAHFETGVEASKLMHVHEYGNTAGNVPARPVFGIIFNRVEPYVEAFGAGVIRRIGL